VGHRPNGVEPAGVPWNVPADYPPILNIFVPHTGQVPSVAGLPFFIVILFSFFISRFALHFTQ
jgi:hypothetical protein